MKNEKAITLVSLVVTIIVLFILAAISISLTMGENGIFTKAQQAGKNYLEAQDKELGMLNVFSQEVENTIQEKVDWETTNQARQELEEFKKKIAETLTNQGVATNPDESIEMMQGKIETLASQKQEEGYQQGKEDGKIDFSSNVVYRNYGSSGNMSFSVKGKILLVAANSIFTSGITIAASNQASIQEITSNNTYYAGAFSSYITPYLKSYVIDTKGVESTISLSTQATAGDADGLGAVAFSIE